MNIETDFSKPIVIHDHPWGFESVLNSPAIVGIDFEWVQSLTGFRSASFTIRYHADIADKMSDEIALDIYENMKPSLMGEGFSVRWLDDLALEYDRQTTLVVRCADYMGPEGEDEVVRKIGINLVEALRKHHHITHQAWGHLANAILQFDFKEFNLIPPHRRVLVHGLQRGISNG